MSPPQDLVRQSASRISELAEAYDPSSANASSTLLHLRRAIRDLEHQCTPPAELELSFHYRPHQNACVRIAIELQIFDHIDDDSEHPTALSELAARIHHLARPEFTRRIVRALCASGVLGEVELSSSTGGEIAVHHTALSRLWRRRPASQAYAKHQWDNMVLALANLVPYLRTHGFQSPDDPSNSPFAYALGAEDVDFFHLLQRHPERLASFNQGMTGTATSVVSIFPFGELAKVHEAPVCLVDVGGGNGHTTQEILTACPEMKGAVMVLQDLPAVLENGDDLQVDPKQVRVQPYDFLRDEQPVCGRSLDLLWLLRFSKIFIRGKIRVTNTVGKSSLIEIFLGAASYLYKSIFHDWPDASCRQILQNLIPAMRGYNSRLLICDRVLSHLASTQPHKALKDINIMMMAGKERTANEWETLLSAEGFRIEQIWGIDNPGNSMIEARLTG